MTIEIHAPEGQIKGWVIDYLKEQLTALHRHDPEISRAEVYFREQSSDYQREKVCEINLSVFGSSIQVRRESASWEQAMRNALEEIKKIVAEQIRRQSEPPDEVISTVDI